MLKHSLRYSEAVSIKSYLTDSSIELYRALLYSHSGCVKEECSRLLVAVFSKECSSLFTQPACWLQLSAKQVHLAIKWPSSRNRALMSSYSCQQQLLQCQRQQCHIMSSIELYNTNIVAHKRIVLAICGCLRQLSDNLVRAHKELFIKWIYSHSGCVKNRALLAAKSSSVAIKCQNAV